MSDLICEAFFGMEPWVDFLWWIFSGRASSEGRLLMIVPMEGSVPTTAQVGQFTKFDEISSSHGGHTSVAASLPRSCLDCMRRSGAPCSSAEHLWVQRLLEVPIALRRSRGSGTGRGPCVGGYVRRRVPQPLLWHQAMSSSGRSSIWSRSS